MLRRLLGSVNKLLTRVDRRLLTGVNWLRFDVNSRLGILHLLGGLDGLLHLFRDVVRMVLWLGRTRGHSYNHRWLWLEHVLAR